MSIAFGAGVNLDALFEQVERYLGQADDAAERLRERTSRLPALQQAYELMFAELQRLSDELDEVAD